MDYRRGSKTRLYLSARRKKKTGYHLLEWRKKKAEGNLHPPEESPAISGRRIVNINYFMSQIQDFNQHSPLSCSFSDMQILSEKRNGLNTGIEMKCRMCNYTKIFWTEDPQKPNMNVNTAAVTGIMKIGGSFSNMEKFFSALEIPCMSEQTFIEEQERLTNALEEMESAVSDDKSLAIQRGDVDSESISLPKVVGVESLAKGSYKTNYASLSGVSSGTTSKEEDKKTDHIPLEPAIEIKEEPVDYEPTPSTSTEAANEEFILPHEENPPRTPSCPWTPPVEPPPNPAVEPQFTLSVAALASHNNPEASDSEQQVGKKRKIKSSTFVPSTNGSEVRPESPVYNFGDSSNPGSLKELRKDQFDFFGEYIAAKLRSLDKKSRAYAQKAIGEIIFEAEMGKYLNEDSESKVLNNSAS